MVDTNTRVRDTDDERETTEAGDTDDGPVSRTDAVIDADDSRVPVDRPGFYLHRKAGSGPLSREQSWAKAHSRRPSNDGRSHTETTFYATDVDTYGPGQQARDPEDRRSWNELAKWNDGMYSDKSRGNQNYWADNQRWIDIITDRVGATDTQRERTRHVFEAIELDTYNAAHIYTEVIILAICSLFVDEDVQLRPDESPEETMQRRTIEREGTAEILETLGADRSDIVDTRQMLLEHDGEYFE